MGLTPQQIFNNVWNYFIVEKHSWAGTKTIIDRADTDIKCFYRGPKSNCAIGCQLPDDLYQESMENKSVSDLFHQWPTVKDYFGDTNLNLLSQLQSAHDCCFEYLEEKLKKIAEMYKLKIPKI